MAYELVAVARTPVSGAAPTLVELGPVVAPDIEWTDQLVGAGTLRFSCNPDKLESSIKARFRDLAALPLEVWLYRDGVQVAAGAVLGYQVAGGTLSVTAPGLLRYLDYMWVTADLAYAAVDQFTIGKGLVDQWQALTYGNYGIVTSGVGTSGVTRTRSYLAVEQHPIGKRLAELAAVDDGFDVHVNPATRALVFSYPTRGADLSASVVFDARNIRDDSLLVSVAPGDLASEAFGLGTGSGSAPISSTKSNTGLRATFGRAGIAASFDGVSVQGTLDDHTQAELDARASQLLIPGSGLKPVVDVDVGSFDVGDTITYSFDSGLGLVEVERRVAVKQVKVTAEGDESMAVSFL